MSFYDMKAGEEGEKYAIEYPWTEQKQEMSIFDMEAQAEEEARRYVIEQRAKQEPLVGREAHARKLVIASLTAEEVCSWINSQSDELRSLRSQLNDEKKLRQEAEEFQENIKRQLSKF